MERGEGRNPEAGEPTPGDQYTEQIQQQTTDLPGGDVFVAHADDFQQRLPEVQELLSRRLATTIETFIDQSDDDPSWANLVYKQLSPYLSDFPSLVEDTTVLAQAVELLRQPVPIPDWVYASGVADAVGSVAQEIRQRQIRDLLELSRSTRHPGNGDS